ncbi:hypothetical protein EJ03DRAFT_338317 [Teratosphaeria nubilosa]|uniref:Uncharacterized protein n=1 Tax=Teratosphaeria nubilosa TaxID=161662 RepID=A0A6G1L281_9PEZI|nr:hypothetical protein EJ03DRAFT_338317 [Teratosphaeria nubilosa]
MRFFDQIIFGMMAALPYRDPPHGEIISALTELYTLLDRLGAIEPNIVRLPPHALDALNRTAALAAGYAPEAVELMGRLPYLANEDVELMPSTVPINHISPQAGRLLHPWATFEGPVDAMNYHHVPGVRPRAFLDPLIKKYRELTYLGNPMSRHMDFGAPPNADAKPPFDWPEADKQKWQGMWKDWQAVRKLEKLYLECGWDVNTSEQRSFRRDEFLQKRLQYWESIEPLSESC